MSEFNIGDRVKVEFEGKIIDVDSASFRITINGGVGFWLSNDGVTVTRIKPPLPTTEGSLIKAEEPYGYLVLTMDLCENPSWGNSDYVFEPHSIFFDYEVLYDAGAQQ